jgi:hypothetical protein
LWILRNAIYAKHGYRFTNPELAEVFNGQSWYKPDPAFTEKQLVGNERLNAQAISVEEEARK